MVSTSKENFFVLDISKPDDAQKWLNIFQSWNEQEPFAHPAYSGLFCDEKTQAKCAVLISDFGTILYPFLQRDIRKEPFASSITSPTSDIITPYGYGGRYMISCSDKKELTRLFDTQFKIWVDSEHIVCEVMKLHLFDSELLSSNGTLTSPQSNIVVDLTKDQESLWLGFDYKVRKNVKKAQRSNLKVVADHSGKYLQEFLDIYYQTMDRRSARENYYFSKDFFETIVSKMQGNFHFFHVMLNDTIISTELCLASRHHIYSFLGGTLSDYFELRPNDLLKYHIILWGGEHGKSHFVLGGGYQDNDGIFKYKNSFAPHGIYPFHIGTMIYNHTVYDALLTTKKEYFRNEQQKDWEPVKGFVPEYRT